MKKNLLTLGVLAISLSSNAQQEVLTHVGTDALFYVSPNTLVYNGGGLETKTTGKIENHGNIMIVGSSSSVLRTVDASNALAPTADRIVLKANDNSGDTYGQLYIEGIPQSNITAVVDREYIGSKHGTYQQFGIPFYNKAFSEINTELGGSLTSTRWSNTEVLRWNNATVRYDGSVIPSSQITVPNHPGIAINIASEVTKAEDKGGYFAFGSGTNGSVIDFTQMHKLTGVPYANGLVKNLTPVNINYGAGGNNLNIYREKYNSYLADPFEQATPWTGTYAKNIYLFSNPFLTNIDLTNIGRDGDGDGNYIQNIQGIVVNPSNVQWDNGTTSQYDTTQKITFTDGIPVGNFPALVIKPFGTFKIKLSDGNAAVLDFDNLRRFAYTQRDFATPYSVTAARTGNSTPAASNTVKQLWIEALDANGKKIGETFYAVSSDFNTGHVSDPNVKTVQALTQATSPIHTFEEDPMLGDVDSNYESAYRLYINEANEVDFKGKKIALGLFDSNVKSLRFLVSENTKFLNDGAHELSTGTGFYYTQGNGQGVQIKHGDVIQIGNGNNYGVYYGAPSNSVLASNEVKTPNRTLVVYNPDIENYIIRFDPAWKSADVFIYDMSGKLVHTANKVKTSLDYILTLDKNFKAGYVVKVVSDKGEIVNAKVLTK